VAPDGTASDTALVDAGGVTGRKLITILTRFGHALRKEGMNVGTGDIMTVAAAMGPLDPTDLVDLYWAGRTCRVTKRDDIVVYHEVFCRFFLENGNPISDLLMDEKYSLAAESQQVFEVPASDPGEEDEVEDDEAVLGLMASHMETLKHKHFRACTPQELEALRRIMARIRLTPPRRRTRRMRPNVKGRYPDLRKTINEAMRNYGEVVDLSYRKRRVKLRPLIMILDISGSMADYSQGLLQFAWASRRVAQKVEVFAFGTRLSYLSNALKTRKIDDALERAAKEVIDWEGGTRIGTSLDTFVRDYGRRGMARGAIVVICSDGLDRGDPELLAQAMERLSRLAHTVVWMNPHKGNNENYKPTSLGMLVAEPHIDVLLSCHDLASLEKLAALLPTLA
jgi:uncharacterized protein with von Willebrand factor type A (vWA) domain